MFLLGGLFGLFPTVGLLVAPEPFRYFASCIYLGSRHTDNLSSLLVPSSDTRSGPYKRRNSGATTAFMNKRCMYVTSARIPGYFPVV